MKNNTPRSIERRNELELLKDKLSDETVEKNINDLQTRINRLERDLIEYKDPESEYALSF